MENDGRKKWVCFCLFSGILELLLLPVIWEYRCISAGSGVPLFFAGLMLFHTSYYRNNRPKAEQNTAFGSDLTEAEQRTIARYLSRSFAFLAPWQGLFVFFFPTAVKIGSVLVYLLAFAAGPCLFRVRHGKELKARYRKELLELEEQNRKEELGKWK